MFAILLHCAETLRPRDKLLLPIQMDIQVLLSWWVVRSTLFFGPEQVTGNIPVMGGAGIRKCPPHTTFTALARAQAGNIHVIVLRLSCSLIDTVIDQLPAAPSPSRRPPPAARCGISGSKAADAASAL